MAWLEKDDNMGGGQNLVRIFEREYGIAPDQKFQKLALCQKKLSYFCNIIISNRGLIGTLHHNIFFLILGDFQEISNSRDFVIQKETGETKRSQITHSTTYFWPGYFQVCNFFIQHTFLFLVPCACKRYPRKKNTARNFSKKRFHEIKVPPQWMHSWFGIDGISRKHPLWFFSRIKINVSDKGGVSGDIKKSHVNPPSPSPPFWSINVAFPLYT